VENYNVFSSLEDNTCMLQNQRFLWENVDSHLTHFESFLVSDFALGDLIDPLDDSAQALNTISSNRE